ncbi:hypothetical protein SAMN04488027_11811 [Psychroflexus sediminis]|uniref:CDP-Glycerol:Poly(Glycerophosphate) glycerophosphotransferase n=2 Tax=Psychroflexus sediminis TaxID=470826 RepID=A0A1G7Z459_9FLAO|nr:hypothetical protein SAMN04488027_11811 [Psychroflexus sediminis]
MPDGVGIKNYIYANVFNDLDKSVTLLHKFKTETLKDFEIDDQIKFQHLRNYKETFFEKYYREKIHLSRLKYNASLKSNSSILSNYMPKKNKLSHKLFYSIVEISTRKNISKNHIHWLEKRYEKLLRKSRVYKEYYHFFKKHESSKLFCTHQRAIIAAPIFAAAKDAGIETITAIYSWDNLPKARLALRADKYIVWSPYMKNELKAYYPEIKNHQIKVFGTPQFEFHYDKSLLWTREKLAAYYHLDMNKKWLCFSGDDKTTSPFDQHYLKDIAKILSENELVNQWQILLRPVPVEGFDKYQEVIDQYPHLIKKTGAAWKLSSEWSDAYPKKEDLSVLSSLCEHADAVINVGSTMALDFGMHQKPAIYINYEAKENSYWSIKRIYKFQHFRSMENIEPVVWLDSPEQIIEILNNLDNYKQRTKKDMELWCEKIIPFNLRLESSQLIENELNI